MATVRKVILVTRQTRFQELVARYHTEAQARFYVEHLGADFDDYVAEHQAYRASYDHVLAVLTKWGRFHALDRAYLPNYVFADDDIVVALGQDGIVANTLKYLNGQPLIGLNPEPSRFDGVLLPFTGDDLGKVLPATANDKQPIVAVTMAQAELSDGQQLRAVNDLFIGPRTHNSAHYEISYSGRSERQSSSGLIVSTGLGSTAWLKSIVTGSLAIANSVRRASRGNKMKMPKPQPWDTDHLTFAVREPFVTQTSAASLVYGKVDANNPLTVHSRMPENGVIFSDGMQQDYLEFTAGMQAHIGICEHQGMLVQ